MMKTDSRSLAVLALMVTVPTMAAPGPDKRPNILFCIGDDASYHHFSPAGCSWVSTPNIQRVANEGIQFDRCYTPNAKSAPSRSVILTGCYSWQLGEAANHIGYFPEELKVFTEVLSEVGYKVACTGKGWVPGNPGTINGQPRELTGTPYQEHVKVPPTRCINKRDYYRNFETFLSEQDGEQPWFFWFGAHEPHRRYEYGTGVRLGHKKTSDIPEVPVFWPDNEEVRNDLLDYGYEIEYFDTVIGQMLAELERRGELDNTLVIVTADNGMPFPRCKGNDYEYANHMPFYMMWKEGIVHPGRHENSLINFIDLAPTILEIAGTTGEAHGMKAVSGKSFFRILKDRQTRRERQERRELLLGRERNDFGRPHNQGYPIRAIIRDNYLYIWNMKPQLYPAGNPETGYTETGGSPTKTAILELNRKGQERRLWELSFGFRPEYELYDLDRDPYCVNNLIGHPELQSLVEALDRRLKGRLLEEDDPRMEGKGDIFDSYRFDKEEKWNFYERFMNGEIKEAWKMTRWILPSDYERK